MDLHTVETFRAAGTDLRLAPGETWVAGGTWLFSEPQPGVRGLVDLTVLGWPAWEEQPTGVSIAATCTVAELVERAETSDLPAWTVARPCAESLVMSTKIWGAATVGGNVCLALPAGAMTSLLAGLGATAVVLGTAGERREPVADLVRGVRRTSLAPGEVVRSFEIDREVLARPAAFRRFALTDMGRSGGVVIGRPVGNRVLVTITGATRRPWVLDVDRGSVDEVLGLVGRWYDDPHGAPDWRRAQTRRCVHEILEELS
ncbi:FAD-binding molybdopterin dehydrogenase [Aeromicrobium sp. 636]|uniref:FAD binding domain-containing protein n=1 Tax=Aeromicrobium senzhongii TaxID=2663859 RepID=A0A8I0K2D8_9ACTN|nr:MULTISPECIES: FAD binding domain-containing protein [Aeromicrobium]MBC9225685.1 FAD binding domain-containing protein [Aeromicrobium senzhongii]MCQ3997795.1 FAD-binding molybdopterin dehydrogenase [Aeromicrobium sp. 636]